MKYRPRPLRNVMHVSYFVLQYLIIYFLFYKIQYEILMSFYTLPILRINLK